MTPIKNVIEWSGVPIDEIEFIELIGGGARIPKIQKILEEYLGDKLKLGSRLNLYESPA